MACLPTDVWSEIFRYASYFDLLALSQVERRLRSLLVGRWILEVKGYLQDDHWIDIYQEGVWIHNNTRYNKRRWNSLDTISLMMKKTEIPKATPASDHGVIIDPYTSRNRRLTIDNERTKIFLLKGEYRCHPWYISGARDCPK